MYGKAPWRLQRQPINSSGGVECAAISRSLRNRGYAEASRVNIKTLWCFTFLRSWQQTPQYKRLLSQFWAVERRQLIKSRERLWFRMNISNSHPAICADWLSWCDIECDDLKGAYWIISASATSSVDLMCANWLISAGATSSMKIWCA